MKAKRIISLAAAFILAFALMPAAVSAAEGDPALVAGTEVLKTGVNTTDAQVLHYGGQTWYVIAYEGKDANGTHTYENPAGEIEALYPETTATLLTIRNLAVTKYDTSEAKSNIYAKSALLGKVEELAEGFSPEETAAVARRDLASGSADFDHDGYDSNKTSGDANDDIVKDALLWPLSVAEAVVVNNDLRKAGLYNENYSSGYWWLRSPGFSYDLAAEVGVDGLMSIYGVNVDNNAFGVRPAINLDLESVLFTSAAEGGKKSEVDGTLTEVGTNDSKEWKLTLLDDSRNFAITGCTEAENGRTIKYQDAKTGRNEYISAVIMDSNGQITYYGRIKNCASEDDASGEVTINTEGILGENDTLYVFNEQYNSDQKTDYASELNLAEIDNPKLTVTVYDQSYVYNGKQQGEGDTAYDDPAVIGEKVKVEGLKDSDMVYSIVLDGEATEIGEYPECIQVTDIKICAKDDMDTAVNDSYDITLVPGKLTITEPKPTPPVPPVKISGTLLTKMTAKGKNSLVLSWSRVNGADGYDIFFGKCGKNAPKKVRSIKNKKTHKWIKKNLKQNTAYKAVVKAYVIKEGKKTYVRNSPTVHAYTSGGNQNYTNAKSVSVENAQVSLTVGNTGSIKATVRTLDAKKKLMNHTQPLRYKSSNKKVATVDSSGTITAVSKGTCRIYVYAVSGARKAVKVTVK